MRLLIDDADIGEIKRLYDLYPVDGVTTNPSILAKANRKPFDVLKEIREFIRPPTLGSSVSRALGLQVHDTNTAFSYMSILYLSVPVINVMTQAICRGVCFGLWFKEVPWTPERVG